MFLGSRWIGQNFAQALSLLTTLAIVDNIRLYWSKSTFLELIGLLGELTIESYGSLQFLSRIYLNFASIFDYSRMFPFLEDYSISFFGHPLKLEQFCFHTIII